MDRSLAELLAAAALPAAILPVADGGDGPHINGPHINGIVLDSRRVQRGSLFCCIPGENSDGHDFAEVAVAAGAVALLCEQVLAVPVPQVVVPDARAAMGPLSAAFYGNPSDHLILVGITGTNGKTTTANLLADVLRSAGIPTGVIGTLTGKFTTPEAPDLQEQLADFLAGGVKAVVMEVSSHALALQRVAGCRFALVVFTNLGRDHLDLHGTLERYFAAKASLFQPTLSTKGVANVDDPHGRLLVDTAPIPMTGFSQHDLAGLIVTPTSHRYRWRGEDVRVGIGGAFNAMNSVAAATAAAVLGISNDVIAAGLADASPVPGRFEPVSAGQPFDIIVDFAHTPDGLREVLGAARAALAPGRGSVIVVFGCGGDRDRDKRPEMGAIAAELADFVVVTSDNPRSEDPQSIIDAVLAGVPNDYRERVVSESDRRRAFAAAFQMAKGGDVVVIAGKGHETTQTIGNDVKHFDDREVARTLLADAAKAYPVADDCRGDDR
ncbi:MAG: UDP-N-acetylmuramoyl-L-alanyl-D-glutamate--2,6-diaminopimelate ligase [Actinobacteria bacterium]|nr:UDP-N-acetylmuramoyl-L-alanyl-D-glutamate--2,6-diaminopimelate ligase [Actinomycetota bacterium]